MRSRLLDSLKFTIGWPLSLIALGFIVKLLISQSNIIFKQIGSLNIFLLLWGMIFLTLYFFLRGFLWKEILKEYGYEIRYKEAIYTWGISEVRRFIPGNIWSFLSRTVLFGEKNIPKNIIFSSLFIEAQLTIFGCLLVSLFASSYLIFLVVPNPVAYIFVFSIVVLTILSLLVVYIFSPWFTKQFHEKTKYFLPQFSVSTNFYLIALALIAYFCFGLGTYLSITSIIFLTPQYVLTLIGLFTFSLLIGYLSLITPMGLGVREAVVTVGLSQFIGLASSGFAAIYSRIILIISELLFLGVVSIWNKVKHDGIKKAETYFLSHFHEFVLLFATAAFISYFTMASFLRHENFYSGRFDFGNMIQTVWNTTHGRIFQITDPNGTEIVSRLSFHADYFLVLLAPLYLIWPIPKMLLLLQTVVVGGGAFFVYKIAHFLLREKSMALLFAILYLLYPSLEHITLYDFHAVTFATTFLLACYYYFLKKQYILFLLFVILAASTKEQIWLIVGFFGLWIALVAFYTAWRQKKAVVLKKTVIFGLLLFFFSLFLFNYFISYAIPHARGSSHFALSYYSDFGETPLKIVRNIFLHPIKTFIAIFRPEKMTYLKDLLLPLGFLPLLFPPVLVFAFPDLIINLLSSNAHLHKIYYQYTATIIPFLFIGAIYSVRKLTQFLPIKTQMIYGIFLVITTLFSVYRYGPLPGSQTPNIDMFIRPQPDKKLINRVLKSIPSSYFVAASNNLGAHLSQRQKISTIPVGLERADIIAFLLNDPYAQPSPKAQKQMVEELTLDPRYMIYAQKGEFIVFKKIEK